MLVRKRVEMNLGNECVSRVFKNFVRTLELNFVISPVNWSYGNFGVINCFHTMHLKNG